MEDFKQINKIFNNKTFLCENCRTTNHDEAGNIRCLEKRQEGIYDIYCDYYDVNEKKKYFDKNHFRKHYYTFLKEKHTNNFFEKISIFLGINANIIFVIFAIIFILPVFFNSLIVGKILGATLATILSVIVGLLFTLRMRLISLYRLTFPNPFAKEVNLIPYYYLVLSIYVLNKKPNYTDKDMAIFEQKTIKLFGQNLLIFAKDFLKYGITKEINGKKFRHYALKINYNFRRLIFNEIVELYTYNNPIQFSKNSALKYISYILDIKSEDIPE